MRGDFPDEAEGSPSVATAMAKAGGLAAREVVRSMLLARIDSFLVLGYVGTLAIGSIVVLLVVSIVVGGLTALLVTVLRPEPTGPVGTLLGLGFIVFWVGGTVLGIITLARRLGRRLDRTLARASQVAHNIAGDHGGGYESEAQERRRSRLERRRARDAMRPVRRGTDAVSLAELDARLAPPGTGPESND